MLCLSIYRPLSHFIAERTLHPFKQGGIGGERHNIPSFSSLNFLWNGQIDTSALARCGANWAGGDELGWDDEFCQGLLWTVVVLQESFSLFCS